MSNLFLPDRIGKTVFDMNLDKLEAIIVKYADMTHPQAGDLEKIVNKLLADRDITENDKQIIVSNVVEEGHKVGEIIQQLTSLKKYCPEYRPYFLPRATISNRTKSVIIGILLVTGVGSTLYYTYDDIATYLENASKERKENKKKEAEMKKIEAIDLMKADGYSKIVAGTNASKLYQTLPKSFDKDQNGIVYINGNHIYCIEDEELYVLEQSNTKIYYLRYAKKQGLVFVKLEEVNAIPTIEKKGSTGRYFIDSEVTTTPVKDQEAILKNFL